MKLNPFSQSGVVLMTVTVAVIGFEVPNKDSKYWMPATGSIRWGGVEPRFLQESDLLDECPQHPEPMVGIPQNFDARTHWKECPSLWEIRDQGYCLSCWAVAIASVLTDRYCIASGGKKNFRFSEQGLLACSREDEIGWNFTRCSSTPTPEGERSCDTVKLEGCGGGSVERAWAYLTNISDGLVSGGPYRSQDGCLEYGYKPCDHTLRSCNVVDVDKLPPKELNCPAACQDTYSKIGYAQDKRVVSSACKFNFPGTQSSEFNNFTKKVQLEIMTNGPVVAVMGLFRSFGKVNPQNENDIYFVNDTKKEDKGGVLGYHAVKVIGWGHQQGKDYWLVTNSYNYYWGHHGFFKIFRGNDNINSAYINNQISTGLPKLGN